MPVRTSQKAPAVADPHDALPRLDRFKPKCGPVRPSTRGRWRAIALLVPYLLVTVHVAHWLSAGSTLTPVEPSEAMETLNEGHVNAGAILFLLLIGSTLVFGRWFCGWACHVVALQDLCAWLLGKIGLRPRPVRSRLLIFVPFAAAFYMFALPTMVRWWEGRPAPKFSLQLYTDELWRTFPGLWMALITFLVCGFLIVWWLGAKGFCTYGCPYGAIFAVADRFSTMRVRVTDDCEHCGHCTSVCSSNVRVHEEVAVHGMVVDPGCMKCGDCVSVCPKDALYFGFGKIAPLQVSQQRRAARADFTWPEEFLLAGVAFASFQWVWRGTWLIEPVPFLLAIGLGVITAVMALLGVRLLLRREVTFQHWQWKRGGRLTGRGRIAAVTLAAFALLIGVLAVGNRLRNGVLDPPLETLRMVMHAPRQASPVAVAEAERSVAHALAWNLGRDPLLLQAQGLLLREQNRHADAEAAFAEAVGRSRTPAYVHHAAVALANYHYLRGELEPARRLAEQVLERMPENATAKKLMQMTERR